jgi:serine/threonine protein phosphatase PrpC
MTQLDEATVKSNDEISRILTQSLLAVDKDLENNRMLRSQGCTACAVYFNSVGDKTSIITANVGDSRAVLSRNHTAIDLSVEGSALGTRSNRSTWRLSGLSRGI